MLDSGDYARRICMLIDDCEIEDWWDICPSWPYDEHSAMCLLDQLPGGYSIEKWPDRGYHITGRDLVDKRKVGERYTRVADQFGEGLAPTACKVWLEWMRGKALDKKLFIAISQL